MKEFGMADQLLLILSAAERMKEAAAKNTGMIFKKEGCPKP